MADPYEQYGTVVDDPYASYGTPVEDAPTQQPESGALATVKDIGKVTPIIEAGLKLATSAVATAAAGVAGIARGTYETGKELVTGEETNAIEKAVDTIHKTEDLLTYKPTKSGEHLTKAAEYPFEKLAEAGKATGEKTFELTGNEAAAAAVETATQFLLPGLVGKAAGAAIDAVNPARAVVATKVVPDTISPASRYDGIDDVRRNASLDAITKSATSSDKVAKARAVLDQYPDVQAATTGKDAKVRQKLEKYMDDPEVMVLIKKAQDTKAAFEEATPEYTSEYKAGTAYKNPTVSNLTQQLQEAIAAGASHTRLKALKSNLDNAMSDFYFPGVPREEALPWINDMKDRQKQSDEYIASDVVKPQSIASTVDRGNRLSIKDPITTWDYHNKAAERLIMQRVDDINKIATTEQAKKQLFVDMEDSSKQNNPDVQQVRQHFDEVWNTANKEGIVKDWVDNYITHMYDYGTQSKSASLTEFRRMIGEMETPTGSGMTTKSRFGDKRIFKTYDEAATRAGLKPLTEDPAELYQVYASSMLKATANKKFVTELKDMASSSDGEKLIVKTGKDGVPRGYETINHPQLYGYAVHKDISPTLRSMFEAPSSSSLMNATHLISMLAKKGIFSLSTFHIKSLGDAFIGALRNPQMVTKMPSIYKQWKNGGAGDIVDMALKGGLEIGHMPLDIHADVGRGIVKDIGGALDSALPRLGAAIRIPAKGVGLLNDFLWKVVHPSFKLATWSANYEALVAKGVEPLKASEMAATFTNDVFGGLNWRRIAENTNSYMAYKVANEAASKSGQRAMQIGMLAPDWTVATARSWEGAFRKGVDPKERAMYQKYLVQSALIYISVADLLNVQFTGHHLWQNNDPTMVDMGDGKKMQLSKHFMEVPHWFLHPNQTMANKLGYVPSETYKQLSNKDYLSASGKAPDIVPKGTGLIKETELRTLHMLRGMTPITLTTASEKGLTSAALGAAGLPIYGQTAEERRKARIEAQRQRIKAKIGE